MNTLYDFSANTLGGKPLTLDRFRGRDGRPVKRYASFTKPRSLAGDIVKLL